MRYWQLLDAILEGNISIFQLAEKKLIKKSKVLTKRRQTVHEILDEREKFDVSSDKTDEEDNFLTSGKLLFILPPNTEGKNTLLKA